MAWESMSAGRKKDRAGGVSPAASPHLSRVANNPAPQHTHVPIQIVRRARPCLLCGKLLAVNDVAEVRARGGVHVGCGVAERRGGGS